MATFKNLGNLGKMGNQLFQLSATIGHSLNMNEPYRFPPWKYEPYFNLKGCFTNNLPAGQTHKERGYAYNPIPAGKNMNLYGYYQSPKYWAGHDDKIREFFGQTTKILHNVASIHVRRGDYLAPAHKNCYTILDMHYYNKAITMLNADKYIVFSNDIPWCKQHFKGKQFIFSEGNPDYVDLKKMMACENHVIANSSFSFWGAWLSNSPNKRVIAPQNWFGPRLKRSHPTNDLIPPEWEQI